MSQKYIMIMLQNLFQWIKCNIVVSMTSYHENRQESEYYDSYEYCFLYLFMDIVAYLTFNVSFASIGSVRLWMEDAFKCFVCILGTKSNLI